MNVAEWSASEHLLEEGTFTQRLLFNGQILSSQPIVPTLNTNHIIYSLSIEAEYSATNF